MTILNVFMDHLVAGRGIELIQSNAIMQFKNLLKQCPSCLQLQIPKPYYRFYKYSLFYCAVYYNQYDIVDFLLTTYPHCYKKCEFDEYIRCCCNNLSYDIFTLLLMKCDNDYAIIKSVFDKIQQLSRTPFLMVVIQFYGNEFFNENPITRIADYKHQLMHFAIENQSMAVIQYLLEYGYDPNIQYLDMTPMHQMVYLSSLQSTRAKAKCFKIVTMLLKYGAFINSETTFGFYPIDLLCYNNNKNELMYLFLLENGSMPSKLPSHVYEI